jgi:hypothetical protein
VRDPERGCGDEQRQRNERADAAEHRQQDLSQPTALVLRGYRCGRVGHRVVPFRSFREHRRSAGVVGFTVAEQRRSAYPE